MPGPCGAAPWADAPAPQAAPWPAAAPRTCGVGPQHAGLQKQAMGMQGWRTAAPRLSPAHAVIPPACADGAPPTRLSGFTRASHSSRVQSAKWLSATSCGTAERDRPLPLPPALLFAAAAARWAARRAFHPSTNALLRSNSARRAWYSLSWRCRRPNLGGRAACTGVGGCRAGGGAEERMCGVAKSCSLCLDFGSLPQTSRIMCSLSIVFLTP